MSKYLLNKFLFTVDRDPELVERYRDGPAPPPSTGGRPRGQQAAQLHRRRDRPPGWRFTDDERTALREHDHVALFEMGAHPFLTLTLFIAMFERDHGPLEYQRAYAERMKHIPMPYPDITT